MKTCFRSKIAECAGLWLAEGDNKTKYEITFTNNSQELIRFFYGVLTKVFPKGKFRLYVYTPNDKQNINLKNCLIRVYADKRARKPYYILRYASVKDVTKWRNITNKIFTQKKYYPYILRGFFAGEGSIKTGMHSNRTIRIAQKFRLKIIDDILDHLSIEYKFSTLEKSYNITGQWNWKKFYNYNLFSLHPDKKLKFMKVWKSYKEIHYPFNFIKNNILHELSKPMTSKQLAEVFDRTQATLQEVLGELKQEQKIINFKSRSNDYWVRSDSNMIIISDRKSEILSILKDPCKVSDIAKRIHVDWKATRRRLAEMERLGLVKQENYLWRKIPINKEVVVL